MSRPDEVSFSYKSISFPHFGHFIAHSLPTADAHSTHRLAALPSLRRRCSPSKPHGLFVQEHHHDPRPGALLVRRNDVSEAMPIVVTGNCIAARGPDAGPIDL